MSHNVYANEPRRAVMVIDSKVFTPVWKVLI